METVMALIVAGPEIFAAGAAFITFLTTAFGAWQLLRNGKLSQAAEKAFRGRDQLVIGMELMPESIVSAEQLAEQKAFLKRFNLDADPESEAEMLEVVRRWEDWLEEAGILKHGDAADESMARMAAPLVKAVREKWAKKGVQ